MTKLEQLTGFVTHARRRLGTDDAFRVQIDLHREGKDTGGLIELFEIREAYMSPLEEFLKLELTAELESLDGQGRVTKASPVDAPTIFHDVWKLFLQTGWEDLVDFRKDDLLEALSETLIDKIVFEEDTTKTPEDMAQTLIECVKSGNVPQHWGQGELFQNFADGKKVHFSMENWAPSLFNLDEDGKKVPLTQMPKGVFHQEVRFKTGKVLVADAIRVDGFHDCLMSISDDFGFNLNYASDRLSRTSLYGMIGVVDVAVGDSGPDIVVGSDGCLFAGESNNEFKTVARVCNDYWGTTMVDRSQLVNVLLKTYPDTKTEESINADIDAWLSSSDFATEITVEPGVWHLYFDDSRTDLMSNLSKSEYDHPCRVSFIVSPTQMNIGAEPVPGFGLPSHGEVEEQPSM